MLKKGSCLAPALALILCVLCILPAGANEPGDLNEYINCHFSKSFPCYTGPGEEYFRIDGNAKYGSGACRVWGSDGNWLMVGFLASRGRYRIGYISRDALNYAEGADGELDRPLSFVSIPAHVREGGAPLTDDPVLNNERFSYMQSGQRVTVLGYFEGWAYVETQITTRARGRGFVRSFNVILDDPSVTDVPTAAPTLAPTYAPWPTTTPTLAPTYAPWPTAAPTFVPTYAPWPTAAPTRAPTAAPTAVPDSRAGLLSSLVHNCPNTGIMLPAAFSPYRTEYVLTVASWVTRVRFTPAAFDPHALITVNGEYVPSGSNSSYITINNNPKRVDIIVQGSSGVATTYTVFLQRRPSDARTKVEAGYISSVYQSSGTWYVKADLVDLQYFSDQYTTGARSTFTNYNTSQERFRLDEHCDYWYGSVQYAFHASDVFEFRDNYAFYSDAPLFYLVFLEDDVVAVLPYSMDSYIGE